MLINNRCVSQSEQTLWFSWIHSLIPQKLCSCLFVFFVCVFKKVHLHKYKCLFLLSTRTFGKAIFLYLLWMNIKVHSDEISSFIPFPCGIPTWLLKEQAEDLAPVHHTSGQLLLPTRVFSRHLERVKCLSHTQRLRPWLNLRLVSHLSYLLCRENSRTICFEKAYAHRAWRV